MREPGLGVEVEVRCPPDETPRSPVWSPLRMPPVTCGGRLSLALELPALIRQLRAAWRARRSGGPGRSRASAWVGIEEEEGSKEEVEEEEEEVKPGLEGRSAQLEGKDEMHVGGTVEL